eukprot:9029535-Lingulodinium_polyedra.AAC.1
MFADREGMKHAVHAGHAGQGMLLEKLAGRGGRGAGKESCKRCWFLIAHRLQVNYPAQFLHAKKT